MGRRGADKWSVWDKRIRDLVIFLLGVGAIANELFLETEIRPAALIAASFMVGIPLTLRADEARRDR